MVWSTAQLNLVFPSLAVSMISSFFRYWNFGMQLVSVATNRCWFSLFWNSSGNINHIVGLCLLVQCLLSDIQTIKPTAQNQPPNSYSTLCHTINSVIHLIYILSVQVISITSLGALMTSALCAIIKKHLLLWVLLKWKSCGVAGCSCSHTQVSAPVWLDVPTHSSLFTN